jgi:hypothetical protein
MAALLAAIATALPSRMDSLLDAIVAAPASLLAISTIQYAAVNQTPLRYNKPVSLPMPASKKGVKRKAEDFDDESLSLHPTQVDRVIHRGRDYRTQIYMTDRFLTYRTDGHDYENDGDDVVMSSSDECSSESGKEERSHNASHWSFDCQSSPKGRLSLQCDHVPRAVKKSKR